MAVITLKTGEKVYCNESGIGVLSMISTYSGFICVHIKEWGGEFPPSLKEVYINVSHVVMVE